MTPRQFDILWAWVLDSWNHRRGTYDPTRKLWAKELAKLPVVDVRQAIQTLRLESPLVLPTIGQVLAVLRRQRPSASSPRLEPPAPPTAAELNEVATLLEGQAALSHHSRCRCGEAFGRWAAQYAAGAQALSRGEPVTALPKSPEVLRLVLSCLRARGRSAGRSA